MYVYTPIEQCCLTLHVQVSQASCDITHNLITPSEALGAQTLDTLCNVTSPCLDTSIPIIYYRTIIRLLCCSKYHLLRRLPACLLMLRQQNTPVGAGRGARQCIATGRVPVSATSRHIVSHYTVNGRDALNALNWDSIPRLPKINSVEDLENVSCVSA